MPAVVSTTGWRRGAFFFACVGVARRALWVGGSGGAGGGVFLRNTEGEGMETSAIWLPLSLRRGADDYPHENDDEGHDGRASERAWGGVAEGGGGG